MLAVHGGHFAVGMQRRLRTGLHHGHHGHGPSNDAGDYPDFSAQWPRPVLGGHPAGRSRHDAGAGAVGIRPHNAGNGRDLRHANRPDRARDPGGAGYIDADNRRHNRIAAIGADDTSAAFRIHNG
jgi:hypothetical protein